MTKRTLKEELERFNNIGSYVDGLSEQFFANMGSGFKDKQGGSTRAQEFMEQDEDVEDLEVSDDDLNLEVGDEDLGGDDLGGDDLEGDDLGGDDLGGEEMDLDLGDEAVEDSEEIDVTELVTMAKGAEEKSEEAKESLDAQSDKIGALVSKIDDLSSKLATIDTITKSIDDLEQKIEDSIPPTPIERLDMRSLDSGPFSEKPLEFWDRKKEEMDERGFGKEYVLTQEDAEEYNDKDIQASFDTPTPEQEEDAEEFKVLGNQPNK
jgi:hypothetical protein